MWLQHITADSRQNEDGLIFHLEEGWCGDLLGFSQHSDLLPAVEGPNHAAAIKQAATVVSGTTRWSWLLLY